MRLDGYPEYPPPYGGGIRLDPVPEEFALPQSGAAAASRWPSIPGLGQPVSAECSGSEADRLRHELGYVRRMSGLPAHTAMS